MTTKTKLEQLQSELNKQSLLLRNLQHEIELESRQDLEIRFHEMDEVAPKSWDLDTKDLKQKMEQISSVSFDADELTIEITLKSGEMITIS